METVAAPMDGTVAAPVVPGGGAAAPPPVQAPPPLSETALAKVDALYEMVEESRAQHGSNADLTRALENKLEDARREYMGGAGPREVIALFGPSDERWVDGCVEVEPGWFVSVVDNAPDWCTVRVNGLSGRVPADILRLPAQEEDDDHSGTAPPLRLHGLRRPSTDNPAHIVGASGSLSAAADAASKGVTGLFSSARRLKAQLATAADELSAAAATAAATAVASPAVDPAADGLNGCEAFPLPLPEPEPEFTAATPAPQSRERSASPDLSGEELRRVFAASLFLRDVGDIRGRLVFTASRLLFVPLASLEESEASSSTFDIARDLLWSTLLPQERQQEGLSAQGGGGGDATQDLHDMVFSHKHVVYFGIERPAAASATAAPTASSSSGLAGMLLHSDGEDEEGAGSDLSSSRGVIRCVVSSGRPPNKLEITSRL